MKITQLTLILALLLSGCSAYQKTLHVADAVDHAQANASGTMANLRAGNATPDQAEVVSAQDGVWVPPQPVDPIAAQKAKVLKRVLDKDIVLTAWRPSGLLEFSQTLTRMTGVPVKLAPDVTAAAPSKGAGVPLMVAGMRHHGSLRSLLDNVTVKLGLSWKATSEGIRIYRTDTRVFMLKTVCSSANLSSTVASGTSVDAGASGADGGKGVSGASSSAQSAAIASSFDLCKDIGQTVNAMLTPGSGKAFLSTATNALVVTDNAEALERIDAYLEKQSKLLAKQVLFNIRVLSVQLNQSDGMGIDLSMVRDVLAGKLGIGIKSAVSTFAGVEDASKLSLVTKGKNSMQLVFKALSTLGKVSEVTSPSITTLNMQPAPLQIGDQTSYVAKTSTTQTQANSQTAVTPGTVTSGFNMTLLPYVAETDEMILQYSLNISALEKIKEMKATGTTIQLPQVSNRIFHQTVRLQSGQTLVMGGFERTREKADANGMGNPWNTLLGGSVSSGSSRDVIVVLITPIVL